MCQTELEGLCARYTLYGTYYPLYDSPLVHSSRVAHTWLTRAHAQPHRVLSSSTRAGKIALVRQMKPVGHLEFDVAVVKELVRLKEHNVRLFEPLEDTGLEGRIDDIIPRAFFLKSTK